MYQASFRRDAEREAFAGPDEDFLRSLELVMAIKRADEQDLSRVEELTLRTSQMNATGVHYSDATLRGLLADPDHEVLTVTLTDRFGPHGAVGVMLLECHPEAWHLKLLATSCRVVSFGAGAVILNWLIDQADRAGAHLAADFRPTDRNRMMDIAYRFAGFTGDPCECLARLGPAADGEGIQCLHLIPGPRHAPTTMRLATPDLSAGRVLASQLASSPTRHRERTMDQAQARGWPVLTQLLCRFLRPYAVKASIVLILLTVLAVGSLYLPNLNAELINNGVVKGNIGYIWKIGGIMLGVVLVLGVVSVVTVYQASRVSTAVAADLRAAIYQRVQAFSGREMSRFSIASLITRNINDTDQIEMFLENAFAQLVVAVIVSVGGMVLAVREGPVLSLLLLVAIPVMALIIGITLVMVVPLFRSFQGKIDRMNQVMREQITGARVIRAFQRTGFEQDRFREVNEDLTGTGLRIARIVAVGMPLLVLVFNLSGVGIVWFGGRLVSEGSMPIGNMTAFLIYILQILLYVLVAVTVLLQVPRAVACAERITQVLETVPAVTDPGCPVTPRITGTVEFRHLTFGYPGSERPVLNDLTFALQPGQTHAIIGGTGSGKSTLIHLILRFFDATGGAVLVDGADVREQSAGRLRATIGLVPQTAFLFGGTVASNLRFGLPGATDEQLWHALDVAQALDFVASMPGQLEARIEQGGSNVSGGQRQRLSIARALVRRPSLYLFDDCFSALDAATDARLRFALRAETGQATVVIATQRASTIMHADQIIVLDAGRVVGMGTHEQLLTGRGPYREIVASQLGEGAAA